MLSSWKTVPQNLYFWKTSKVTGCIRCSLSKIHDRKKKTQREKDLICLELRFQLKVIVEREVGSENVGQRPQLHGNEGQIQVERSCRHGMLFQGAILVPYFSS